MLIDPVACTATNGTQTGLVDTLGWDHAEIMFNVGTAGSTSSVPTKMDLTESDEPAGTFTTIAEFISSTIAWTAGANTAGIHRCSVDLRGGRKRYLKAAFTNSGQTVMHCVTALLTRGEAAPTTAAEAGARSYAKA